MHKQITEQGMTQEKALFLMPHKPYNLWDMVSFLADGLIAQIRRLERVRCDIGKLRSAEPISGLQILALSSIVGAMEPICAGLGCLSAEHQRKRIKLRVQDGTLSEVASGIMAEMVDTFLDALRRDIEPLQFALIPKDKAVFFEQPELFGDLVGAAFPSAKSEIQDAGNCMAANLHTAAVFHLMRAAEHGLRGLARRLRVRLSVTLEYAGWEEVIRAIDKKLGKLRLQSRGRKKSESLEFYRLTLSECEMLKDVWRNPVSHTRKRCSEHEALAVYGRVREFMERLAGGGVKESN